MCHPSAVGNMLAKLGLLHCAIASGTVYCNRSSLCVCGRQVGSVCYHNNSKLHGSVGAGSDHLQLIKFWRSCTPGRGSAAGGRGDFVSVLLQLSRTLCIYGGLRLGEIFAQSYYSQRAVFVSLCGRFSFP